ncbi:hypothetical protein P280DRAFT_410479 [Massarina eburnea CBS 473.64]|uniref:Tcp11-domain-containing protein n=1 Tax=Massarina eburnea CBS 473.64 TaxID=1395130 RepID=A0A6A6RKX9_9PLEO|nr:hypothetical protein P280DRAFT_410479 [Massarina eburnea CBS 473.64]
MPPVRDPASQTWPSAIASAGCAHQEACGHHASWSPERNERSPLAWSARSPGRAIPEQLAELLVDMIPGMKGAELGEAFQRASEQPPVTKQSLSELDIQNIIQNIKLRHDVNFDKGLSFRPNLDGPKGQEKRRHSDKYWLALVAELELYVRLFQGTPPMCNMEQAKWAAIVKHAQRRIPKMFETIHDVLKSLVPDRDHARVDEHFDVPMLMQEIERGVCDLVKRAEWVAILLKEHCAPMRDVYVDSMVQSTKQGVAQNSSSLVIAGLRELLGILEVMKLDVANHQIRNLKPLLIEDTVNYERHYHLDRLVNKRSKVNIDAAQKWWASSVRRLRHRCDPTTKDVSRFQLEIFTQAVVANLFSQDASELPDTFYLDYERIRVLKSEVDELTHFEICFDMFAQCLKDWGFNGPIPAPAQNQLRTALSAMVGEGTSRAPHSWLYHSEALSLEIHRQATLLSGRPFVYNHHDLQRANVQLRRALQEKFSTYSVRGRNAFVPLVSACIHKHFNSSPSDLFSHLVVPAPAPGPLAQALAAPSVLQQSLNTFTPLDRLVDVTQRVAHIVLLHWRVWGSIAYVVDEESCSLPLANSSVEESPLIHAPRPRAAQSKVLDFDGEIGGGDLA